jgi:hypothetical protein
VAWLSLSHAAHAVDAITVGPTQVDAATLCCLGFVVPIVQGDANYNAVATVQYREVGESAWRTGLPLLRVRPETISTETPPSDYGLPDPIESFAGSIFGLKAGTSYEVRLTVTDPDGGGATETITTATRAEPLAAPSASRVVPVATQSQLTAALGASQPGDVIEVAAGTYNGSLTFTRSGTAANPIIVRGASQSTVVLNATGRTYGVDIRADYVYVERLTVQGSQWGGRIMDSTGAVIRRVAFRNIQFGIDGMSGSNVGVYICDNTLQGPTVWPDISSATWDTEGIAITGEGHTICHNTLSGFGDALGLHQNSAMPNAAIDFYGNEVLWSSDDALELDYAHRNVRAFENRVTNAGMGVSLQPVWGGPVYIFKNVFVNLAHSPYKLNNEPTGFMIFNNTSIRTQGEGNYGAQAWPQLGYQLPGHWSFVANFQFKNNVAIGVSGPARVTSALQLADLAYNGWSPDGTFVLFDTFANLADVKNRTAYEAHSLILAAPTFAGSVVMPASYTTLMSPQDVSLNAGSNAVDAALVLPNINDDYVGNGPDLGALERGAPLPVYGVRPEVSTVRPNPPTNLTAQ